MAELDDFDYELKDEELVDFEGSDYGFGSDEELELEEEEEEVRPNGVHEDPSPKESEKREEGNTAIKKGEGQWLALVEESPILEPERKDGTESGEIEEEKDEKGVVMQPVPSLSLIAKREDCQHEGMLGGSRRRHRKAELEDGELDDAAMPEGSDHEPEGNADDDEGDNCRRGRKRRKDRFAAERLSDDPQREDRESMPVTASTTKQHYSRGSDRQTDRSGGLLKTSNAGGRGIMQGCVFGHPANMGPGIMGPGQPFVPLGMGAAGPVHPTGRGFVGPVGRMSSSGAVGMNPFQEAMAVREHMLRSHRMMQQFVHANSLPGRPSMAGPMGGPGSRPMMGLEFGGIIHRGMMHAQIQGLDLANQMSCAYPVDNCPRSPSSGRGGTGGMFDLIVGRMGSPRHGYGRQGSWPVVSMSSPDMHPVGRGRGRGRGQIGTPIWSEQGIAAAQVVPGQGAAVGHHVNMAQLGKGIIGTVGGGVKVHPVPHSSTPNTNQGHREGKPTIKRIDPDGTWKLGGDHVRNGVQRARSGSKSSLSGGAPGNKREREDVHDRGSVLNSTSPQRGDNSSQGNETSGGLSSASNLIQLGGPVQKSRLLTVSGLPENTSMSVVVEAFEKQGKITDFRKEERGDAFTITFATVPEAISAKRHLHRSVIAGRQITVEYAVQAT